MPDFNQDNHLVDQNLNEPVVRPDPPIDAPEEVKDASSSDEELNDDQIDLLMSEAYDSDKEQEDEKFRGKLSTRKNVPGAYASRCIFGKAKKVGKPVIFD